ncbi:hypothetical protein KCU62_g74, partial [Aureobasidium sp. EXF-3399]
MPKVLAGHPVLASTKRNSPSSTLLHASLQRTQAQPDWSFQESGSRASMLCQSQILLMLARKALDVSPCSLRPTRLLVVYHIPTALPHLACMAVKRICPISLHIQSLKTSLCRILRQDSQDSSYFLKTDRIQSIVYTRTKESRFSTRAANRY